MSSSYYHLQLHPTGPPSLRPQFKIAQPVTALALDSGFLQVPQTLLQLQEHPASLCISNNTVRID